MDDGWPAYQHPKFPTRTNLLISALSVELHGVGELVKTFQLDVTLDAQTGLKSYERNN